MSIEQNKFRSDARNYCLKEKKSNVFFFFINIKHNIIIKLVYENNGGGGVSCALFSSTPTLQYINIILIRV